jgi:hypothetical protein
MTMEAHAKLRKTARSILPPEEDDSNDDEFDLREEARKRRKNTKKKQKAKNGSRRTKKQKHSIGSAAAKKRSAGATETTGEKRQKRSQPAPCSLHNTASEVWTPDPDAGPWPVFGPDEREHARWHSQPGHPSFESLVESLSPVDVDFFRLPMRPSELEKFADSTLLCGQHSSLRRQPDLTGSAVQVSVWS